MTEQHWLVLFAIVWLGLSVSLVRLWWKRSGRHWGDDC